MKVSEAINKLEVGETVWVKGKVLDLDKGGYDHCPLEVSLFYEDEWIHENDEISLTEPNSISDEKVLELVSTHFRFDKENFWNQLKEMDMLPQAEKVEVPSCMGTFLDRYPDKKETAMHIIMHDFCESKYFDEFAEFPLADYPMGWDRLMASALMFGYTVKPKRWVVKNEEGRYFVAFSKYAKTPFEGVFSASVTNLVTFDDQSKAEAVAVLVEGSVEEV